MPSVSMTPPHTHGLSAPQVKKNAQRIYDEMAREEAAFTTTLERGSKLLTEVLSRAKTAASSGAGRGLAELLLR